MLKTFVNSSICRTIFLLGTLLCQSQLYAIAGEKVASSPIPSIQLPDVGVGAEKFSDAFARAAKQSRPSLVRIQPCYGDTESSLGFAIPFELGGIELASITSSGLFADFSNGKDVSSQPGTGVIVTQDGYIWTSSEVVRDAKSTKVTLATGEEHPGKIVFTDEVSGLAIIKIDAVGLTPLTLAESREPRIAEWAIAVSAKLDDHPSLSTGFMWLDDHSTSSRGTRLDTFSYNFSGVRPEPGCALINTNGQLIGIDVLPPLPLRTANGVRHCLAGDSALALHNAVLNGSSSTAKESPVQESVVSSEGISGNAAKAARSIYVASSSEKSHTGRSFASKREDTAVSSTKWFGDPIRKWVDWLKDSLPPTFNVGGIDSK